MTKEEKQQKREERIERAKDFAGHCVERAADTIITTALAIVVGKCISNGNEGNGDDKDNFFGL